MNPLIKLIQINHSFQKSVNLQLDLDNYERIGSYIPTRSSIAILKRYWNIVSGKSGESASVLIGPYGKGKSHLLLVLLALLHGSMERDQVKGYRISHLRIIIQKQLRLLKNGRENIRKHMRRLKSWQSRQDMKWLGSVCGLKSRIGKVWTFLRKPIQN